MRLKAIFPDIALSKTQFQHFPCLFVPIGFNCLEISTKSRSNRMANLEHLKILKQGVEVWNKWRDENPEVRPVLDEENLSGEFLFRANFSKTSLAGVDLTHADLRGADFTGAFLQQAYLRRANLSMASLAEADLCEVLLSKSDISRAFLGKAYLDNAILDHANLRESFFTEANLYQTNLAGSDLSDAIFYGSDLSKSNLTNASLYRTDLSLTNLYKVDFTGATIIETNFKRSILVETILSEATLQNCNVYGISAWKVQSDTIKEQTNLRVSPENEPIITVDNLEVAHFIYLLLNNDKIRNVIDTIGQKGVLILGRFSADRKTVLDAIRDRLRELGFVPMMFDFEKPTKKDFTETIKTLAGLSRFIILLENK
jgi:uncharacterized protein YjbI with pentapeptide repeats